VRPKGLKVGFGRPLCGLPNPKCQLSPTKSGERKGGAQRAPKGRFVKRTFPLTFWGPRPRPGRPAVRQNRPGKMAPPRAAPPAPEGKVFIQKLSIGRWRAAAGGAQLNLAPPACGGGLKFRPPEGKKRALRARFFPAAAFFPSARRLWCLRRRPL
jgi:hypothetical protein